LIDIRKLCERLNLRVESLHRSGGGHYKVSISNGTTRKMVVFPCSSSDRRWLLNKTAELNRIFNQHDQKTKDQNQ
jgi:hypothetical protein